MDTKIIKSVTNGGNYAALVEREGRLGVGYMMADDHRLCFYSDKDLAYEVFDRMADEVLGLLKI